jgi:hypothetical protein
VRSGLRYLRYAPNLQGPLIRAFVFAFFVSAVWSLLAVVAKKDLHGSGFGGAMGYGILNGCLGAGAVVAAGTLARVRRKVDADHLLFVCGAYFIVVFLVLGLVRTPWILIVTLLGAGYAWTSAMSTLNVSVQLSVPGWVYARALGTYLMTFQGGLAVGSVLWGLIAERSSVRVAMLCAAAGTAVSLPFTSRIHILKGSLPDLTPYMSKRPIPTFPETPQPDDGPVRISIDYRIPWASYAAFTIAIHELKGARLRDGAVRWGIYRDAADPEHLNETFIMESWLDYLRSRERTTAADQELRKRVWDLHAADEPPRISHQVWAAEVGAADARDED